MAAAPLPAWLRAGAPSLDPLPDLQRLPPPAVVQHVLAWHRAHLAYLDGRLLWDRANAARLRAWRAEAVERAGPWLLLAQAQRGEEWWCGGWGPCVLTVEQRLGCLRALQATLGPCDYYRGVLPSVVAAEYFSAIE